MISRLTTFFCLVLICASCGRPTPSSSRSSAKPNPATYRNNGTETGTASWYGGKFHGRATASGEIYDQDKLTAAHRFAPFHTMVQVTNLDNGRTINVTINDRGPFVKGRIIDLSRKAAKQIGMLSTGTARVRLDFKTLTPQAQARRYYIQAGSFSDPENAQFQRDAIAKAFPSIDVQVVNIKALYKLQIGKYTSKDQALVDIKRLRAKNFDGIVLQFP